MLADVSVHWTERKKVQEIQHALVNGVVPPHVLNFSFPFAELHDFPADPFL